MKKKKSFTVEEAASVMDCHPSTIHRLLAEGWLNEPVGRPKAVRAKKAGESARISGKSLFQLMIYDSINHSNGRNYKDFKHFRKNFRKFYSQTSRAKRFSIDEGRGKAETAPSTITH